MPHLINHPHQDIRKKSSRSEGCDFQDTMSLEVWVQYVLNSGFVQRTLFPSSFLFAFFCEHGNYRIQMLSCRGMLFSSLTALWHTPPGFCCAVSVPNSQTFSVVMLSGCSLLVINPLWIFLMYAVLQVVNKALTQIASRGWCVAFLLTRKMDGISSLFLFDVPFKVLWEYWAQVRIMHSKVQAYKEECEISEYWLWFLRGGGHLDKGNLKAGYGSVLEGFFMSWCPWVESEGFYRCSFSFVDVYSLSPSPNISRLFFMLGLIQVCCLVIYIWLTGAWFLNYFNQLLSIDQNKKHAVHNILRAKQNCNIKTII